MTDELEKYFSGRELYGDDFTITQIEEWFADEAEGYANLSEVYGEAVSDAEHYPYGALNQRLAFRHLQQDRFTHALGLGSSTGAEFLPIIDRIDALTILEPSQQFRSDAIGSVVPTYVDPQPSGDLPFADGTFDLVTSFGVLHHIPNVTHVVTELARCTAPGGWIVIREPSISMGDWRQPRPGLTKRERGIPQELLEDALTKAGFEIRKSSPCLFPTTGRLGLKWPKWGTAGERGVILDGVLSRLFARNHRYHATTKPQKLRPTSVCYVARKAA